MGGKLLELILCILLTSILAITLIGSIISVVIPITNKLAEIQETKTEYYKMLEDIGG